MRRVYKKSTLFTLSKTDKMIIHASWDIFFILSCMTVSVILSILNVIINFIKYARNYTKTKNKFKNIGYTKAEIYDMIYKLSPRGFEIFIAELYKTLGYNTKLTKPTNDGGVDIILNNCIFVECKHFKHTTKVSRPMVQKLLGSSMMYGGDKCILITSGRYTKEALECVKYINNLELMDMCDIEEMLFNLKPEQITRVIMKASNSA